MFIIVSEANCKPGPRSALVEDEEERRVSYIASLTRVQPSSYDDVRCHQVHPRLPSPAHRPRSVESDCILLKQLPPTLYLRIIVFTSSPQAISFPDLSAVQVPEVPGVVFSLYINPTLRKVVQIAGLEDIDWEGCTRASIREFRIMENGRVAQEDADGIIDTTPGCNGKALARPLQIMPETFCIRSGLKELAEKIMEQEGTCW